MSVQKDEVLSHLMMIRRDLNQAIDIISHLPVVEMTPEEAEKYRGQTRTGDPDAIVAGDWEIIPRKGPKIVNLPAGTIHKSGPWV